MGMAYNYISFLGNQDLKQMLHEIKRRFDEFKAANPTGFSKESIGYIFYGLNPTEFAAATDISGMTKNLRLDYFDASETQYESGVLIPTDFQDHLTTALAKIDPHVVAINYFNTTHNEYGYYISVCKDAANGDFEIVSEYDTIEDQSATGRGVSTLHKRVVREIHKQVPWSKKVLKA
jgi:hypothetical protein